MFIFMPGKRDPNKIRVQTWRRIFNSLPERLGCSQLWGMTRAKLKPTNDMAEETAPLNTTSQPQSLAASDLLAHCRKLAETLSEVAGYLAATRTDRGHVDDDGEVWALQTMDYAEGAAEYAAKANALLEEHDALMLG